MMRYGSPRDLSEVVRRAISGKQAADSLLQERVINKTQHAQIMQAIRNFLDY